MKMIQFYIKSKTLGYAFYKSLPKSFSPPPQKKSPNHQRQPKTGLHTSLPLIHVYLSTPLRIGAQLGRKTVAVLERSGRANNRRRLEVQLHTLKFGFCNRLRSGRAKSRLEFSCLLLTSLLCSGSLLFQRPSPVPLSVFTLAPDLLFKDRVHLFDRTTQKIWLFCSLPT